jgi:long-chain acyl-CoA synthetase
VAKVGAYRLNQRSFEWQASATVLRSDAAMTRLRALVRARSSIAVSASGVAPIDSAPTEPTRYLHCATSGTGGQPKVIRRAHPSWIKSFVVNGRVLGLSSFDCVAVFGTLAHSLVLYGTLEAAHHGARILGLHGLRPDRQLAALAREQATILYITPTQLGLLSGGPARAVGSLRHILVGGGRLGEPVATAAAQTFPNARLIHFYGAAETSFVAWSDETTPPGSVGAAYPGVTISIRDDQGARTTGIGEIWVKSPYLFDGYASGQSTDTRWDDGHLSIGELGRLDDQGNLFVAGRKSRMVTISDSNVFPEEIERFLAATLGTDTVAVIPLPDAKRGHRLVAVVAGPCAGITEQDLLVLCRQTLGPLRAPRRVHFVPALPMLPVGKPDYRAITKWAEATT